MNTDRLRGLLLGVFVLGLLGTSFELLLLEHFETWQQWLPLALLGLGLLAAVRVRTSPGSAPWPGCTSGDGDGRSDGTDASAMQMEQAPVRCRPLASSRGSVHDERERAS